MKENELSAGSHLRGAPQLAIELPSMTITKFANGYTLTTRGDETVQHLIDCNDLWDVSDNLHHYLHLTPPLLIEIYAFRKKCAELNWDESAIARFYSPINPDDVAAG